MAVNILRVFLFNSYFNEYQIEPSYTLIDFAVVSKYMAPSVGFWGGPAKGLSCSDPITSNLAPAE
jgi:hypothetical protein